MIRQLETEPKAEQLGALEVLIGEDVPRGLSPKGSSHHAVIRRIGNRRLDLVPVHIVILDITNQVFDDFLTAFACVVYVGQQVHGTNSMPGQYERGIHVAIVREGRRAVSGENQFAILKCTFVKRLAVQIDSLVAEAFIPVVHLDILQSAPIMWDYNIFRAG